MAGECPTVFEPTLAAPGCDPSSRQAHHDRTCMPRAAYGSGRSPGSRAPRSTRTTRPTVPRRARGRRSATAPKTPVPRQVSVGRVRRRRLRTVVATLRNLVAASEDERRHAELAKLDLDIEAAARRVDELTPVVGDPDGVGRARLVSFWAPRALALEIFAERRVIEVRELRGRVAALRHHPNAVRDQSGRARSGEALLRDTARLRFLEAIPPVDAADMCSECPTPAAWHSLTVTFNLDPAKDVGRVDGPCPAWPWWRAAGRFWRSPRARESRQWLPEGRLP